MSQQIYLADGFWPAHEMCFDTDREGQVAEAGMGARTDTAHWNLRGRRSSSRSPPDSTDDPAQRGQNFVSES